MLPDQTSPQFRLRLWLVAGCSALLFLGLGVRLWWVQVGRTDAYDARISRQTVRRLLIEPVRGRIFAADGTVLADNQARYDLVFHLAEMRRPGVRARTVNYILEQGARLSSLLERPLPVTRERLERHLRLYPARALVVYRDLTPVELARVCEMPGPPPGLEIVSRVVRTHPCPGVATHVLGFTGWRPWLQEEPAAGRPRLAYAPPALVGRDGLERFYDSELRGRPGERLVRVDILGYIHGEIGTSTPAADGADLLLTLDLTAQRAAERALRGRTGALVAVEVDTGAVLAMASSPTYDLASLDTLRYAALAADETERPLLNRALSASYIPGSILKPLIALAALRTGALAPADTVLCPGACVVGDQTIGCWKRSGHGSLDLLHALEGSCNVYFIQAGLRTGLDELLPTLAGAGFGRAPEVDLPGSAGGFLPSRNWAHQVRRSPWTMGDTAFISIGQGPVTLTPLQAALYAAALANGGNVYRPYLVRAIRGPAGSYRSMTAPIVRNRLPATAAEIGLIRDGMALVVQGAQGTARDAFTPLLPMAGKTGTAEVDGAGGRHKNAWFIGFGPVAAPRYAVAVLVERGTSGGQTASPIARRFLDEWLGPGGAAP